MEQLHIGSNIVGSTLHTIDMSRMSMFVGSISNCDVAAVCGRRKPLATNASRVADSALHVERARMCVTAV
jgi:hypothetical protein